MEYCNQCGELVEGRFCRMCGAPTAVAAAQAVAQASGAGTGYGGGYGAPGAEAPVAPAGAESTQYYATPLYEEAPHYPAPAAQPGTPSEFDGFFRSEDGSPSPHAHTQLLPPVQADYRMDPPGGSRIPPSMPDFPDDEDDEDARHHRLLMYGTLGAVLLASAVILGMLFLGGGAGPVSAASGLPTTGATQSAGSTSGTEAGNVVVPTQSGGTLATSAAPSTAPASSAAAGGFSGDSLPLGPGSQGTEVKYVQQRLKELGYYNGSISGTFDQATALAVQQFQAAAGVTGDAASTVGQHTLVALIAAGSTPNLHTGSRSSSVTRLNEALNEALGSHLTGSSRYTATTMAEVMRYQVEVGLTPSGQVDAATWAKLQSGAL